MNIYVGNLSPESTESELRDLATPYGQLASVSLVMDKETGKAKGFGFVEFGSDAEGTSAIAGLNGREIHGKTLKVSQARPKFARAGA